MSDFDLPKTSLDFAGMGALRGKAQRHDDKATRETATQFEAMFIQMMLKSMRDAVQKNDPMRSSHQDTFEEMYDRELSVQMAKRNTLGVADMIVKAVERNTDPGPAYKAKAEPMQLKPEASPMTIEGPKPMELVRPAKFNVKPRAVSPTGGTGAE